MPGKAPSKTRVVVPAHKRLGKKRKGYTYRKSAPLRGTELQRAMSLKRIDTIRARKDGGEPKSGSARTKVLGVEHRGGEDFAGFSRNRAMGFGRIRSGSKLKPGWRPKNTKKAH